MVPATDHHELLVSIDTLVSGIHFPVNAAPFDVGYKAMAVNLSDMAAMGAEPVAVDLALTAPAEDHDWMQAFSKGFLTISERFNTRLLGVQVTTGPLSVTVQIYGKVPAGQALRRARARPDDSIYVTGSLGNAGVALLGIVDGLEIPENHQAWLEQRLNRPEPRIAEGINLRGIASSAIILIGPNRKGTVGQTDTATKPVTMFAIRSR